MLKYSLTFKQVFNLNWLHMINNMKSCVLGFVSIPSHSHTSSFTEGCRAILLLLLQVDLLVYSLKKKNRGPTSLPPILLPTRPLIDLPPKLGFEESDWVWWCTLPRRSSLLFVPSWQHHCSVKDCDARTPKMENDPCCLKIVTWYLTQSTHILWVMNNNNNSGHSAHILCLSSVTLWTNLDPVTGTPVDWNLDLLWGKLELSFLSLPENVVFLTQEATADDTRSHGSWHIHEISFAISLITRYNTWCLL